MRVSCVLSAVKKPFMLRVIMLSVFILCAVMLSAVAKLINLEIRVTDTILFWPEFRFQVAGTSK